MKKQLKDYLHLYLGCDVKTKDGTGKLIGIVKDEAFVDFRGYGNKGYTDEFGNEYDFVFLENEYFIKDVEPILRPISHVTHEELNKANELLEMFNPNEIREQIDGMASNTKFYFDKHVDVFGLIESGLAVNAATLETVKK